MRYITLILILITLPGITLAQNDPTFISTPPGGIIYGGSYDYLIEVNDLDADPIEVNITSGSLAAGLSFIDNLDGTYSIQGTPTQTGIFPITLEVSEIAVPANNNIQAFDIVIAKADLNVIADPQSITFGQSIPALTFTYNNADFVNGDTDAVIDLDPSIATTATTGSNVGSYPITLSGGSDDNYNLLFTNASLEITRANQSITFNDPADRTYGDATFDLVATATSGLAVAFNIISGPASLAGNTVTITGAGTVLVEASQSGNVNFAAATPAQQSFDVAKADLNVIADPQSITFGQAIPALTFTYNNADFVNGDTDAVIDLAPSIATTATTGSNVGSYPITLSGGSDDNYNLLFTNASLEITQASQSISFNDPADRTYGDATFDLVATATSGSAVAFNIISGPASLSGNTVTILGAGTVLVEASQSGNVNFAAAIPVQQSFDVAKAALNVIADPQSIAFGQSIPVLTFAYNNADFVNGDTDAVIDLAPSIATTATSGSNVGSYPIILSGGSDDNYNLLFTNASLEITQASQSITFNDPADRTYGDPTFDLVTSATSGLAVAFNIISGPASLSGNTVTILGAGTVLVEASQSGNVNFAAAIPVQQSFDVAKADLNVIADPQSITFGQSIPTLTFTYNNADFVNGDTDAVIDLAPSIATTATTGSNVGSYPITLSGGSDDNYNLLFTNASLEITQASQSISFNDPADRTYGDATFDLVTSATSGLAVTFNIISGPASLSGNTVTITGAGTVLVEASQSGNVNFAAATPVQQSFEVSKADLNVIADPQSITFGQSIPALTFAYNNADFVNGDTDAVIDTPPNINTTATSGSNAGIYSISLTGGNDDDYNFIFNNSALTINQASQNITFNPIPDKVFGDANFDLIASASSGLPVTFNVISGPASLSGNTVTILGAGIVFIEASQSGNINYLPANVVERSFEVANASASINFTSLLKNFDGSPRAVEFDTNPPGLATSVTYNGSNTIPTNPSSYAVEVTIIAPNFEGSALATFVINGAPDFINPGTINYNEDQDPISNIRLTDYFTDAEDNAPQLSFEITDNSNPSLFSQFSRTGSQINITLTPNAFGLAEIDIRCTDSNGLFTDATININVASVQDDPTFVSSPVTMVNEDATYVYNIVTADNDATDVLTITNVLNLPAWLNLVDNGDGSAVLSGVPTNSEVGDFGIALEVRDDKNNNTQQLFNLEVVNTNDTPIITSVPVTSASVNTPYSYTFTATDIDDSDVISITVAEKPAWLNVTPDGPARVVISGTPLTGDRDEPTNIRIVVSDLAGAEAVQEFNLDVNFPNSTPTFTSSPPTTINEDQLYTYNISIDDLDDDPLSLEALLKPDWLTLSKPNGNFRLRGRPRNGDVGPNQVILRVADQLNANTTQNFTINVINVNDPPVFDTDPILVARQNTLYSLPLIVNEVDANDELTFEFTQQPAWLSINEQRILTGTPLRADVENSPFDVAITVTDEAGASDILSFTLEVVFENSAPTLDALPPLANLVEDDDELKTITLSGITAGEESDQIISVMVESSNENLFSILSVDYESPATTGQLNYQLVPNAFGSAEISVTVEDDGAEDVNSIQRNFTIEVAPVNDEPEINSSPVTKLQPGTPYIYNVQFSDPDPDDELTLSIVSSPAWMNLQNLTNNTAELTGTIPSTATAEEVVLRVEDAEGAFSEQSFNLEINSIPAINNLQRALNEDESFIFTPALLNELYSDQDDDPFYSIILNWQEGKITFNQTEIVSGQELILTGNFDLRYTPPENYAGDQLITLSISDSIIYSENGQLLLTFIPVNDAPVLTNIETTTLAYIQGADPIIISESVNISDIDDQFIEHAIIKISTNYNNDEDRLNLETDEEVTSAFDVNTGILEISGELSKSAYENVLAEVNYFNTNSLTDDTTPKFITFQIGDGDSLSNTIGRTLSVTEILPELDIVSAFTPNNDGVNDTWDFVNLEQFENVRITIFDSNRRIIFDCSDKDCAWDGTLSGNLMPAGSYFYSINLNDGRQKYNGTLTLIR